MGGTRTVTTEGQGAGADAPEHVRRISPSAVMAAAAGLVLVAWSAVALARAGTGRPLGSPIVEVGGFTTTAILGLIVLGTGAVLLLAAATRSRTVVAVTGVVVTAAAVALAIEPTFDEAGLGAERDFAIAVAILAGTTALIALFAEDVVRVTDPRAVDRLDEPNRERPGDHGVWRAASEDALRRSHPEVTDLRDGRRQV